VNLDSGKRTIAKASDVECDSDPTALVQIRELRSVRHKQQFL
jgi:hypothetical protein